MYKNKQRAQAKDIQGYGTDLYENQTYLHTTKLNNISQIT